MDNTVMTELGELAVEQAKMRRAAHGPDCKCLYCELADKIISQYYGEL